MAGEARVSLCFSICFQFGEVPRVLGGHLQAVPQTEVPPPPQAPPPSPAPPPASLTGSEA